jgi:hypothetical protein
MILKVRQELQALQVQQVLQEREAVWDFLVDLDNKDQEVIQVLLDLEFPLLSLYQMVFYF